MRSKKKKRQRSKFKGILNWSQKGNKTGTKNSNEFILYMLSRAKIPVKAARDTPSSEGVVDVFWAKGPFLGPMLSMGITARPGLRITQDSAESQDKCVGTR